MTLLLENGKHPSTQAQRDCPECDGSGTIMNPEWKDWFKARVLAGILYNAPKPKHPKETICGCTRLYQFQIRRGMREDVRSSMIGKTYGRLIVTGLSEKRDPRGNKYVFADCACGTKQVEIRTSSLHSGDTKSCGCLRKVRRSELRESQNAINH